jgi:hypothetical protein
MGLSARLLVFNVSVELNFVIQGGGGGIGGLNPPVVCLTPPNKMPWDTLGGQFQPPAVVNDAESPVRNDNDNE